ncbi:MAG TPA: hypothetical protein VF788_10600 [Pseudonocardiaceae bacterium]|jgi:hypothetical protein
MAARPRAAAFAETGDGLDPAAGTARWTAAMRALESARPVPIGSSTTPWRRRLRERQGAHLDLPAITTVFKLDRPDLLRLKNTLLARTPAPRCTRRSPPLHRGHPAGPLALPRSRSGTPGVPYAYLILGQAMGTT